MSKENYEEELVKLEKGVSYLGLLLGMNLGFIAGWLGVSQTCVENYLVMATVILSAVTIMWIDFSSILAEAR